MGQNTLKIKANSMDLELSGDADYVRDAYEAIREVVQLRFQQTLKEGHRQEEALQTRERQRRITKPLFKSEGISRPVEISPPRASRKLAEEHIRLAVCGDLYHKISVLSRQDFRESIFDRSLSIDKIDHIFIDEDDADLLSEQFEVGRTLWRELTAAGRAMVQGNST